MEGWQKGMQLSTAGFEEDFLKDTCDLAWSEGVASRQNYVYTDDQLKKSIDDAIKDITGNIQYIPQQCLDGSVDSYYASTTQSSSTSTPTPTSAPTSMSASTLTSAPTSTYVPI